MKFKNYFFIVFSWSHDIKGAFLIHNFSQNTADVVLKKFALLITDVARPVLKDYENTVEKVYDADVVSVNFLEPENTAKMINAIVSNYTQGAIKDTVKKDDLFKVCKSM